MLLFDRLLPFSHIFSYPPTPTPTSVHHLACNATTWIIPTHPPLIHRNMNPTLADSWMEGVHLYNIHTSLLHDCTISRAQLQSLLFHQQNMILREKQNANPIHGKSRAKCESKRVKLYEFIIKSVAFCYSRRCSALLDLMVALSSKHTVPLFQAC